MGALLINPGSENKGGTFAQAKINADAWLESIHEEGFTEVEMSEGEEMEDGNFLFVFTHKVTGKAVELWIHGFTDKQCREDFIFSPRVYWNGSSCGNPKIEDWMEEGYGFKIEYFKK